MSTPGISEAGVERMRQAASPPLEALSNWLADHYRLTRPIACQLIRSYTNDVYAIKSGEQEYVVKVYGNGWRSRSEVAYEAELLKYVSARGLRVPGPIANRNGYVSLINHNGADRQAVLFKSAEGEKPRPPFTRELYFAFGRAIARFHELSNGFATEHDRARLDLSCLIDTPLAQALPLMMEESDRNLLSDIAARLRSKIADFVSKGLEWGPIHGDATLDNLHVTAGGEIILFDFDSGGPGWRASDLQGWAAKNDKYCERWDAFYDGYCTVRQVIEVNWIAAPYLTLAWDIWGLKVDLDNRIRRQGREKTTEYLAKQMAQIRSRCDECQSLRTLL